MKICVLPTCLVLIGNRPCMCNDVHGHGFMDFVWIISAYRPRLSGHQRFDMLTDFTKKKEKKNYSPCNTFGGYNTQGTHFKGLKKKKEKITFQRNKNKKKTSISHYLVSVKNRNPPVTFIQELCRLYTVCTLTLLIIHCLYVYEQFKKKKGSQSNAYTLLERCAQ